jgi:thiol-disulfide isomerase/thioredoxin
MLDQKYFGLSLATWSIILLVIVYFIYCTKCRKEDFSIEESKIKVYNFNTKWCGYSVNFQKIFDEFQKKHKNTTNVEVIDVKCDDDVNKNICEEYSVQGYPSVIFKKGQEKINYEGERTVDGLEEQLQKLL